MKPVQSALRAREPAFAMMSLVPGAGRFTVPDTEPEGGALGDYGPAPQFLTKGN